MKFFVSYNQADQGWAVWIAWQVEASGHSATIQAWDFRPGENFVLSMQKAIQGSDRTIAVLTEQYLSSGFCSPEWAAAFAADPTGAQRKLVPVRVGECDLTGLLGQVVYIDLVGLEETAARNTLLNGIAAGRAKPLRAPGFPGGRPGSGAQPSFPGSAPAAGVPPGASGTTAAQAVAAGPEKIHVAVEIPRLMLGVDTMPLHLRFAVETPNAGARVVFTQKNFVICDSAGVVSDDYRFAFPEIGSYEQALQIQASESKDAQYVLSLLCEDSQGNVLTRNSFKIRVAEPPAWWKLARSIQSLFSWIFGAWPRIAAGALILALAGSIYFALLPADKKRAKILAMDFGHPSDLLNPAPGERAVWNDDFSDRAKTDAKWRPNPAAARWVAIESPEPFPVPATRYLQIDGPGAVYTQEGLGGKAFFDFDMNFTVTLLEGGAVDWLVRAWPLPAPRRAYRLSLSAAPRTVSGRPGTQYDLQVSRCSGAGLADCRPLPATQDESDWVDPCDRPRHLNFVMRVRGPVIQVAGAAIALGVQGCSKVSQFSDRDYVDGHAATGPQYGAIGFEARRQGAKVALETVSVSYLSSATDQYFAK